MSKNVTFTTIHFVLAFTAGYLLSESLLIGLAIALIQPACNGISYLFHEKLWGQVEQSKAAQVH